MITQTEGYWERIARIKEEMLKVAYAENKALKLKEQAYLVWQDKTDWIQNTAKAHELGMHRADVLKQRIEELQAQLKEPEQEPVAKKMTAHRAVYFMERFKHEEKLLGPNEQAALDFVIALLTTPPQRKPLTRGQIREIEVDVSLNPSFDYITPAEQLCRAIEAAHGIKGDAC